MATVGGSSTCQCVLDGNEMRHCSAPVGTALMMSIGTENRADTAHAEPTNNLPRHPDSTSTQHTISSASVQNKIFITTDGSTTQQVPSITHSLFHSRLKTHLFTNIFHRILLAPTCRTASSDYKRTGLTLLNGFSFLVITCAP